MGEEDLLRLRSGFSVAVYYQENDFMNEGYRPEDMTFRIHLVW